MKLKFYYKNVIKVENEKKTFMWYEFNDGVHFSGGESVYHDREGKNPPIIVFFEGRLAPLGEAQTDGEEGTVDRMWNNMDVIKTNGGLPSISRNWLRGLAELLEKTSKYLPLIVVGIVLVVALLMNSGG